MKSTMRAVLNHPALELQVVVGGGILLTRYGDYAGIIEADGFRIDRRVPFLSEGDTLGEMARSAGQATLEMGKAFEELKPGVVVVIADRYEALSITHAALCLNIPIAHLEGGEVSGSIDESIRHAITKLAHVHFPATEQAADRIRRMGELPESVIVVGSPSLDLLTGLDLSNASILNNVQWIDGGGKIPDFRKDYIVVSQHPVVTEYDARVEDIGETAEAVRQLGLPVVWVWPNMDAGSATLTDQIKKFGTERGEIYHVASLPMELYAVLLKNARCLVGNSSSGIRECEFLGVPVVNIGTRQHGRQRGGNVIDVPYERTAILKAIHEQIAHGPYQSAHLYGDGRAEQKIAETLARYEFGIQKTIAY
jgi:UDP-hydrolysing UDP-N-acetyl-D-glucosamine 2-epimerase